jgi:WD40 repeat protein
MGKPFADEDGDVGSLALSPKDTMLAIVSGNVGWVNPVQLWNVTRATPRPSGKPFGSISLGIVDSVAFSPDGTKLAVIGAQFYSTGTIGGTYGPGQVQLWNIRTGKEMGSPFAGVNGGPYSVGFSPDGAMLVTIGADGAARLWKTATGQQIGNPIRSGTSTIESVAFSPDSTVLATGDYDGNIRLWDIAAGQQIGSPIGGGAGFVAQSIAFLRNGAVLAAGGGPIEQLWDVGYLQNPLTQLCSQVGGSFTPSEWTQYVPTGPPFKNGCPQPAPSNHMNTG